MEPLPNIFFGPCRLCDCDFMGNIITCSCKHERHDHIPLFDCTVPNCTCQRFISDNAECECTHDMSTHTTETRGGLEEEWLRKWSLEGKTRNVMLELYMSKFDQQLSFSTLKRKLQQHNIRKCDTDYDVLNVVHLIKRLNSFGVYGYKRVHSLLRVQHRINISRQKVVEVIEEYHLDKGAMPETRLYHQKPYVSRGPNWIWSIDGHEKLAQPYGLYIYGCIDTFSRKIISLSVLPDKTAVRIEGWLADTINGVGGQPHRIMADMGSEYATIKANYDGLIQMTSIFNQKIECMWSGLLKDSDINRYREILRELEDSGDFDSKSNIHRECIWEAFAGLVQTSLNQYIASRNICCIRKQKGLELPSGSSPNDMYTYPEQFGCEDYLEPLSHSFQSLGDGIPRAAASKSTVVATYLNLLQTRL